MEIADLIILALITFGAVMILGFLGNLIFNRTQIPSIVWLLLFGVIVGFIFKDVIGYDPAIINTISKFFGAAAIIIILFDPNTAKILKDLI